MFAGASQRVPCLSPGLPGGFLRRVCWLCAGPGSRAVTWPCRSCPFAGAADDPGVSTTAPGAERGEERPVGQNIETSIIAFIFSTWFKIL